MNSEILDGKIKEFVKCKNKIFKEWKSSGGNMRKFLQYNSAFEFWKKLAGKFEIYILKNSKNMHVSFYYYYFLLFFKIEWAAR